MGTYQFHLVFVYIHALLQYLTFFFAHAVCNWLLCIAMPHLDIDTRRVVFLKSAAG